MIQRIGTIALVTLALSLGIAHAAQDETPTPAPAPVQIAPGCSITNPEATLIVVCAASVITNDNGQFVAGNFYVQAADRGWQRLTPCDDLIVMCDSEWVRAEGVSQGDAIPLGSVD